LKVEFPKTPEASPNNLIFFPPEIRISSKFLQSNEIPASCIYGSLSMGQNFIQIFGNLFNSSEAADAWVWAPHCMCWIFRFVATIDDGITEPRCYLPTLHCFHPSGIFFVLGITVSRLVIFFVYFPRTNIFFSRRVEERLSPIFEQLFGVEGTE